MESVEIKPKVERGFTFTPTYNLSYIASIHYFRTQILRTKARKN